MPTSKYEILLVKNKTDCFYRENYINYSKKWKSSMAVAMFTLLALLWNISAKMIITTPNELINQLGNNGVVDHKIANLGIVPYGHSIIGNTWIYNIYITFIFVSITAKRTNMDENHTASQMVQYMKKT